MKLPKWNGATNPGVFAFTLVCFVAGYAAMTALSLGRVKYDDRDGPGWNPITRLPDGKVGLSQFAVETLGFVVVFAAAAAFFGLGLLWRQYRLS